MSAKNGRRDRKGPVSSSLSPTTDRKDGKGLRRSGQREEDVQVITVPARSAAAGRNRSAADVSASASSVPATAASRANIEVEVLVDTMKEKKAKERAPNPFAPVASPTSTTPSRTAKTEAKEEDEPQDVDETPQSPEVVQRVTSPAPLVEPDDAGPAGDDEPDARPLLGKYSSRTPTRSSDVPPPKPAVKKSGPPLPPPRKSRINLEDAQGQEPTSRTPSKTTTTALFRSATDPQGLEKDRDLEVTIEVKRAVKGGRGAATPTDAKSPDAKVSRTDAKGAASGSPVAAPDDGKAGATRADDGKRTSAKGAESKAGGRQEGKEGPRARPPLSKAGSVPVLRIPVEGKTRGVAAGSPDGKAGPEADSTATEGKAAGTGGKMEVSIMDVDDPDRNLVPVSVRQKADLYELIKEAKKCGAVLSDRELVVLYNEVEVPVKCWPAVDVHRMGPIIFVAYTSNS